MLILPTETEPVVVVGGDCLDVMPDFLAGTFAAVITDPPYGTSDGADKVAVRANCTRIERFHHDWDIDLPLGWFAASTPALLPGGAVMAFTDNKRTGDVWAAGVAAGLNALHTFHWIKPDPPPTPRPNFASAVESGVFFRKPGKVHRWNGGGWCRNVFTAPLAHKEHDGRTRYHPTEKPVSLMRWLIELVTDPGDLVLDPFGGSGTTAVACVLTGRRCVVIERDPQYLPVIRRRIAAAMGTGLLAGLA